MSQETLWVTAQHMALLKSLDVDDEGYVSYDQYNGDEEAALEALGYTSKDYGSDDGLYTLATKLILDLPHCIKILMHDLCIEEAVYFWDESTCTWNKTIGI